MTAIVTSLIIVTQSSHDASNLDQMSQEIFVTFWYLYVGLYWFEILKGNKFYERMQQAEFKFRSRIL